MQQRPYGPRIHGPNMTEQPDDAEVKVREPLRIPAFARFWTSESIGVFGMFITVVAADVLVVQVLHASEAEVGMIRAVQFLPYLLVGLVAGALVDRWRRRPTLVGAHLGAGIGLLAIPVMAATGHLSLPLVAAVLFAVGIFGVFRAAAQQSFVPDLVPRHLLVDANARIGQSATVAETSGPALGGALIGVLSAPLTLLISAISHLVAAATVATVRVDEQRPQHPQKPRMLRDIRQGLGFVYRHRTLAPLGISTHVWFIANSAAITVFALYALRQLGVAPVMYGLILGCAGVGGLIGALCSPVVVRRFGEGPTILIGRAVTPVAWMAVAMVPNAEPWVLVALAAAKTLYGFGLGLEDPPELGYRQSVTPQAMLGRVNATMRSANRTMAVLGSLLGGLLAATIGYRPTFWLMIAVFGVAVAIIVFSPMRTARSPVQ